MLHKWLCRMVSVVAFVSLFFVSDASAQYAGKMVESVDIQGNRRLTDEELLKYIKTRPGDKFDESRGQQDLRSLVQTSQFDPTSIRIIVEAGARGGVYVIFVVRELPLVTGLSFKGLHYVSEQDILADLRARKMSIEINETYSPVKTRKVVRIIREYLANRGYADAQIYVSENVISATSVTLTLQIDELPGVDEDDVDGSRGK